MLFVDEKVAFLKSFLYEVVVFCGWIFVHSGEIVVSQECVYFICVCVLCYYDHRSSFVRLCEYCIACYKFLSYLLHNVGHSFVRYIGDAVSIDDLLQCLGC